MVSRGTLEPVARQVRQVALADFEHAATLAEHLTVLRFPVDERNSTVRPGTFDGLDLESGRARRNDTSAEIRARCTFASGQVRAVRVSPTFKRGDLLWVTPSSRKRADSEHTLEVVGVDAKRLQDCGDQDAMLMGAGYLPNWYPRAGRRVKATGAGDPPRVRFASAWDGKFGRPLPLAHRWLANPWCWELRVIAHRDQVDWLIGHALSDRDSA